MKTNSTLLLALVVALTPMAALAQSASASTNLGNSVSHSAAASREILLAGSNAVAGSVKLTSGALAVPVWMSGAVVTGSGAIVTGVGDALTHGGTATSKAADKMWDAATGDPDQRPALNREIALPKPQKTAARPKDPSPADALQTGRR